MRKVFLIAALLWPVQLWAAGFTANDLQKLCGDTGKGEPKANMADYDSCVDFLRNGDPRPAIKDEHLRQAWLAYVKKFPQELSWDASTVAFSMTRVNDFSQNR
ncbi:MAG: hypothetical protein ACI8W7_001115 [Gammaproteobacteria bacterium]|jgi:hypothetical protein